MLTEIFETIAAYPKHLACPFFISSTRNHLQQTVATTFGFSIFVDTNKITFQTFHSPTSRFCKMMRCKTNKFSVRCFFWAGTLLRTKISGQIILFHLSYLLRAQVVWGRYNLLRRYPSWELTYPLKRQFWVDDFPFPFRWDMAHLSLEGIPFTRQSTGYLRLFPLEGTPCNSERSFSH